MIVTCPACQVNYRLAALAEQGQRGRCSRCDAEFPLNARPSYQLMPAMVDGADLLVATAGAISDWPDMPAVGATSSPEIEAASPEAGTEAPVNAIPASKSGLVDLVVAGVLATAGAMAGYYLSLLEGAEYLNWAATGGAVGLTLAWMTIRWTRRKS